MGIKRYSHIIENTEIYNFMLQVFADEYFTVWYLYKRLITR